MIPALSRTWRHLLQVKHAWSIIRVRNHEYSERGAVYPGSDRQCLAQTYPNWELLAVEMALPMQHGDRPNLQNAIREKSVIWSMRAIKIVA